MQVCWAWRLLTERQRTMDWPRNQIQVNGKVPMLPYMIPLICYLAILSSSVIFFLQEVFYKAQKLGDEPTDENIFKELSNSQVVTSLAPSSSTNAVDECFYLASTESLMMLFSFLSAGNLWWTTWVKFYCNHSQDWKLYCKCSFLKLIISHVSEN